MKRSPLFTIALALALAIVVVWWQLAEKRAREESYRADRAGEQIRAMENSLRALRRGLPPPPVRVARTVSDVWLRELKHQGVSDPLREIPASLARHPELIPFKGVEGGSMGFYDQKGMVVLDGPWVLAPFEDGHVLGYGVFEYSVGPGGRLSWKRVAAQMMD